ncbi:MAG: homoserine O-succinyltransferase [Xanthomonadales bacterium]|nr:homoserine O-succinyltransferase [Xanthomonadales bacterium]
MRHAGARRVFLRVESVGVPDAPCIWVAGGISADRHATAHALDPRPGWWNELIGVDCAVDPRQWRVLACDWVGSEGDIDAPIDTADQADAIALALDALGISSLHAFIGASYGGMVALQFAARHPLRVDRIGVLSAADRPHPFASAFRALQRQVVTLGQLQCSETLGLSLARQLAMLSYRTPEEFGSRFDAAPTLSGDRARCAAEDYLSHCGNRYVAKWSATAFLRLSESIDLHQLDPTSVHVPCALFSVSQDWLAPPEQIDSLSDRLPKSLGVTRLDSAFGHDAFLKERDEVGSFLRSVIDAEVIA